MLVYRNTQLFFIFISPRRDSDTCASIVAVPCQRGEVKDGTEKGFWDKQEKSDSPTLYIHCGFQHSLRSV